MKGTSTYKNVLLLLVLCVLWLPMVQNKFMFAGEAPLSGDVYYPKEDSLTTGTWFSAEYQAQQEVYLNSAFGFRNFCIRLNNQLAYSLFKKAKANQVIVGKENYLFEQDYVDTYMGEDFMGTDSIERIVKKLEFISDTLKKLNKDLILILAAGKASYYPEFIPDQFKKVHDTTNYQQFAASTLHARINVIDFNKWFVDNKKNSEFPLYPQYGIHWSKYASYRVTDSIIKKIENLRGIDMPDLYYDTVKMEQPHGIDYDIGDGMNLLFKLKSFDMAYMKAKFTSDSGKVKPHALMIGDSFYWNIYDFGLSKIFATDHFWYYNGLVYPESFKEETLTDYLDFGAEIKKQDVIMMMVTEANLKRIGWGFIDNAYSYFKYPQPPHSEQYFTRLKQLYKYIQTDAVWLQQISERAKKDNQALNTQIIKEAKWLLSQEKVY